MDPTDTYYTMPRPTRQGFREFFGALVHQGYDQEEAEVLADLRMMETPFCDECGAEMTFNGLAVAWDCPQCGWRRRL